MLREQLVVLILMYHLAVPNRGLSSNMCNTTCFQNKFSIKLYSHIVAILLPIHKILITQEFFSIF